MNAEVHVASTESNAIPEESIVTFAGKEYVFIETNKQQYQLQEVSTGTKEKGFVALTNTATLKDKPIVTRGAYTLLMKLKNREE